MVLRKVIKILTIGMLQREHSMLTFETESLQGAGPIAEKLIVCSPTRGILFMYAERR